MSAMLDKNVCGRNLSYLKIVYVMRFKHFIMALTFCDRGAKSSPDEVSEVRNETSNAPKTHLLVLMTILNCCKDWINFFRCSRCSSVVFDATIISR